MTSWADDNTTQHYLDNRSYQLRNYFSWATETGISDAKCGLLAGPHCDDTIAQWKLHVINNVVATWKLCWHTSLHFAIVCFLFCDVNHYIIMTSVHSGKFGGHKFLHYRHTTHRKQIVHLLTLHLVLRNDIVHTHIWCAPKGECQIWDDAQMHTCMQLLWPTWASSPSAAPVSIWQLNRWVTTISSESFDLWALILRYVGMATGNGIISQKLWQQTSLISSKSSTHMYRHTHYWWQVICSV